MKSSEKQSYFTWVRSLWVLPLLLIIAIGFEQGTSDAQVAEKTKSEKNEVKLKKTDQTAIQKSLKVFRNPKGVTMDWKKTSKLSALGSTIESKGLASFFNQKFKLETALPEKSLIIYDGKAVWSVPRFEDDGKISEVYHSSISKKKSSDILVFAIILDANPLTNFKFLRAEVASSKNNFYFKPKIKDPQIEELWIQLDEKKKNLVGIGWKDELQNESEIIFEKEHKDVKLKDKDFNFKKPADTKVIDT